MILVKDTDAKSVNAAILALNDDLDKQVKAVKNTNAGIVEGETYNINISGNSGSVKNALTITSTTGSTVYDGSEAKTATIYTPDQSVNKASSPTFEGLNLTGTSLTVTSSLTGASVSNCWAKVYGNILRLHIVIPMTAQTIYNGAIVFTIGGTLPTMAYVPTRFALGIDTSNYRYNGGIDIQQNGQCHLYIEDGTDISFSGNIANVIGLYGDCMLTLN